MTDLSPAAASPVLAEVVRGPFVESLHRGAAVVCRPSGEVVAAWGDAGRVILPRSACKMLQALPLVESGAADAAGLGPRELALACASHQGAAVHVDAVGRWLAALGLGEADLRCGAHAPYDDAAARLLVEAGRAPCQIHNNCSGKHAGFVTLNRRLGGGAEYVAPDHPVQRAVREAIEEVSGEQSLCFGIDGCSAPTFAVSLNGIALAMARMADPSGLGRARGAAARRLVGAMRAHPLLVAGEGRACSELMAASASRAAVKFGAEGVYVAILPDAGLGVALKIEDGAARASECAVAAILARLGLLDPEDPAVARRLTPIQRSRCGQPVGHIAPDPAFWAGGVSL
jgi:L-asparaginase II